jgi:hypothetical protein
MKPAILRIALACLFILAAAASLAANESSALQRYGIVIGINEGGPKRSTLRFAASDAQAFAAVMQEMGGLSAANRIMLLNPMLDDITQAFADMGKKIAAGKSAVKRQEFIVYYSGHSDEEGLLIGEQKLGYKDLRALIAAIPADVRIAVIDSCASGVFIRTKGGVQRPPFMVDAAVEMKGYAFLTSSSETEAAQESDNIEASFFTHFLVSGLRGAADVSKDGVVTLNEAYQYAFNETLVRTEKTQYGPQHPSYDIQLSGTGDLVLTDLRETSAGLIIEDKIAGRIYVRDARGKLVVELNKQDKQNLEIGLSAGGYTVLVDTDGALRRAGIRLVTGRQTTLRESDLKTVQPESTVKRGDADTPPSDEGAPVAEGETPAADKAQAPQDEPKDDFVLQTRFFRFTFFPSILARIDSNILVTNHLVLNLTVGRAQNVTGVNMSLIGGIIDRRLDGFAGSTIFNIITGGMTGAAVASVFNIGGGDQLGVQAAGVFNIANGTLSGLQTAGVFNIADGALSGVQAAGVFNIAGGSMTGVQAAGVFNVAGDVNGVQVGVVNIAKKVSGVQVGVVNISDDTDGFAIGLINIEKNGIHNIEVWHDTGNMSCAAFKLGTKISYGIVMAGYDFIDPNPSWFYGLGIGFRLPIETFFIDLDAVLLSRFRTSQDIFTTDSMTTLLPQLRLKTGVKLFGFLGVYAGVSLQFFIPGLLYDPALMTDTLFSFTAPGTTQPVNVVPKFFIGIQLF